MRKVVLFMHTSLDGFVARPNGEMDWVRIDDEMFDYAGKRTDEADLALYGRVTFQLMESYWPTAADQPDPTKHDIEHSKWYNSVKKVIVSKTMKGTTIKNATIVSDQVSEHIRKLKNGIGKEIIMFGSPTLAHLLMDENLIDNYWLFVNPILIGKGIPLFKPLKNQIELKLLSQSVFKSGVVCLHYETKKTSNN